jgi:hypothetical protein
MTPPNEDPREEKQDDRLESILKTVRSIDHNVEEILGKIGEHFEDSSDGSFEPVWAKDYGAYLNDNDY